MDFGLQYLKLLKVIVELIVGEELPRMNHSNCECQKGEEELHVELSSLESKGKIQLVFGVFKLAPLYT